ncbi:MAG: peptidase, partial [Clostridiales bacterium]|nr:peptidase [Clostridiales bacterium]
MQEILQEEKVVKIDSFKGIDGYKIVMNKFKTSSINIFFHDNISRKNVTLNAMIPAALRRGCESHPSMKDIALYQEELYGSVFDCGVTKKGELQIMQFYIEFVSDRFTSENANLFGKCFGLLEEIITKPVLENGCFKKEYVEQEKENLKSLIESRVNDKMQYAVERCFEEMCKEEPFGIHEYGFVEDLKEINEQNLWQQYRYMLETLPISVFITGNFEDENLKFVIDRLKKFKRTEIKKIDC